MKAPEAADDTDITSIIKTWHEDSQEWEVEISWENGVAPYTLVSSTSPSFEWGVETLGKEIPGPSFTEYIVEDIVDDLFFNVTDASVISRAVEGLGYEPAPAPGPPVLTVPVAWWGSTVQFNASYLDPIAPANLSFFNKLTERAFETSDPGGSAYSTWAKFMVPWDARSSIPATIQSHSRMSPGNHFLILIPDLSYTNIRGVVWAEQTEKVWVAASNLLAEVDLFKQVPTSTPVYDDIATPYISRVSAVGTLVMVDGSLGVSQVYLVDVSSGGRTVFAQTKDSGFTRDILPVGIALTADGQTCYIADASSGSVVKIPAGAGSGETIVDSWGGKSDFVFANPAPIDVAESGTADDMVLVVNNVSPFHAWKLIDENTAEDTNEGFIQDIHSLEVDRDLSTQSIARYVVTTAGAAAEAFNFNDFGLYSAAYHGSRVHGGDDGQLQLHSEDTEWQIYPVWPRDPQRVIISNSVPSVPYTSSWQVADRVIEFKVTGWPGLELNLELIDPPDTAAYAPEGGWDMGRPKQLPYVGDDNVQEDLDTDDIGLSLDPTGPWKTRLNVTPGSGGEATAYLKVTDRYAGDNYQVRVKKCRPGGCDAAPPAGGVLDDRVVALSPIFTAWKRIHIERDKMFRKGGVLAENYVPDPDYECGTPENPICDCIADPDANCCQGIGPLSCNQIVAYEWQNAAAGDQVAVFDTHHSYENGAETRNMTFVAPVADSHGLLRVTLDQGLAQGYLRSSRQEPAPPATYQPDFQNHESAGYGVISACDASSNQINATNSCFYQADLRGVEQAYNDAFVEVFAPREGMSVVSYLAPEWILPAPVQYYENFSYPWFEHELAMENYVHVIGASKDQIDNNVSMWGWSDNLLNFTYVFRGSCEASGVLYSKTATEVDNFTKDTLVHELGHQWSLNCCSTDGHDTRDAWCEAVGGCGPGAPNPEPCVERVGLSGTIWDAVSRFCREDLFDGDPTCGSGLLREAYGTCPIDETSLRKAPDPL